MSSDIIREFVPRNTLNLHWYRTRGPYDYMRPAWVFEHGLFVWCDEHLRWNEHGVAPGETKPGHITGRVPHHDCGDDGDGNGVVYYCMGLALATPDVAKILKKYPRPKATHTPPPIRRVYPGLLIGDENSFKEMQEAEDIAILQCREWQQNQRRQQKT
jgi:hypothetical protein